MVQIIYLENHTAVKCFFLSSFLVFYLFFRIHKGFISHVMFQKMSMPFCVFLAVMYILAFTDYCVRFTIQQITSIHTYMYYYVKVGYVYTFSVSVWFTICPFPFYSKDNSHSLKQISSTKLFQCKLYITTDDELVL